MHSLQSQCLGAKSSDLLNKCVAEIDTDRRSLYSQHVSSRSIIRELYPAYRNYQGVTWSCNRVIIVRGLKFGAAHLWYFIRRRLLGVVIPSRRLGPVSSQHASVPTAVTRQSP